MCVSNYSLCLPPALGLMQGSPIIVLIVHVDLQPAEHM